MNREGRVTIMGEVGDIMDRDFVFPIAAKVMCVMHIL